MPYFGSTSKNNLATAHPLLQELFNEIIKRYDISINCGHRTEEEQNAIPDSNTSVQWPNSKHNTLPSMAVDWQPYPLLSWTEPLIEARFANIGGYIQGVAERLGIQVIVGYDWDSDGNIAEHKLKDFKLDDYFVDCGCDRCTFYNMYHH